VKRDEFDPGRIRAVLFDLDGTLLQVEMESFIPAYIAQVGRHFAPQVAAEPFQRVFRSAIRALLTAETGDCSNQDRFLDILEHDLQLPAERVAAGLEAFYQDGLADLAGLIRPLPLARNILARCFKRDLKVVIATNPVFPRPVVDARLRWGGIADFPFELVTTLENCRFCKPQPGFFEDLLRTLGLTPEACLMVGNDTGHDLASRQIGIPTFLVDTWLVDRCGGEFITDFRGGHLDLFRFLGKLGASRPMN
jgi:FMN phosphatase YigB (HAD superfamily)